MTLTIPWLERKRLVKQLEAVHERYQGASRLPEVLARSTLDEYFKLCLEIADFNHVHPELAIPKLVEGRVPAMPSFGPPSSDTASPAAS